MGRKVIPEKVEEAKHNILSAAFDIIYTEGLSQFSLSKVAARADITKAGIYWYFESKEDLINDMALTLKNTFISPAQSILQQPVCAMEKIKMILDTVDDKEVSKNCSLIIKIFLEVKSSNSLIENTIKEGYMEYLGIVTSIFEDAIKCKELETDMLPCDLAKVFITSLDAYIIQKEIFGDGNIDILYHMFFHSLASVSREG